MNFPNTAIPVDVTVVSKEDDYISPLYFFASQSDLSNCTYIAGTAIPGGGSEDVRFYFTPDAPGTWNLWVATDESGNNVIGKGSVEIKAEPTGTVTLEIVEGTSINKPDGVVDYELTVKNIGDVPFYRNFWSHLWVSQEGGWGWSSANDVYTEPSIRIGMKLCLSTQPPPTLSLTQTPFPAISTATRGWMLTT